jgi:hypothetical protein
MSAYGKRKSNCLHELRNQGSIGLVVRKQIVEWAKLVI